MWAWLYEWIAGWFDSLSQFGNAFLLKGCANESISGRSYRQGWQTARRWINRLFFWQADHCRGAYMKDLQRARDYIAEYERRP